MPDINDFVLDELIRDATGLLRVDASLRRSVFLELALLREDIERLLVENDPSVVISKLRRLQARVNNAIDDSMGTISGGIDAVLLDVAELSLEMSAAGISKSIGFNLAGGVSKEFARRLVRGVLLEGAPNSDWWTRQGDVLKNRFIDEMRAGLLNGEALGDLVRRVRGRRENGFRDGIMSATTRKAEALVRTAVVNVANGARREVYEKNSDLIKAIQWVSVLDNRTSQICRALDGKQWSVPDYKPIGHDKAYPGETAHWNCRSTQTPILKSWSELSGKRLREKVPVGVRASMNGEVPADLTYEEWLRKQPVEFQKDTLGPARYLLWTRGKLSLTDMTDARNRPLTVAELREKVQL